MDAQVPFKLEAPKLPKLEKQKQENSQKTENNRQRQILSKLIFPPHIPGECHPKVSVMASIVRELEEDDDDRSAPLLTMKDLPKIDQSLAKDLKNLETKCGVFKKLSNQYQKDYEKLKADDASKKDIMEAASYAKLYELNFNYCIATVSSPKRMRELNSCFKNLDVNTVRQIAQAGQLEYICPQERKAVERAVGQKVQRVVRASQNI